ncbi:hypothetical protein ACFX5E_01290 [Flavobacterium sp. LS2P90]|uniref:PKD domain-containing protein n=1 Tax=Flavobacterium xylosi TaxID=3230415 RepID=A0ABW6HRY1_9FLAO
MKNIKFIFGFVCLLAMAIGCTVDGIDDDTSFIETAVAPTNVAAFYNITQDNTGLVTITPAGEGAVSYDIFYGDSASANPAYVLQGKSTSHIYKEGTYTVKIVAFGITGLKTETTQSLVVSLKAPQNLVVTITNDLLVSKKVNVTATAQFATMFDVYFGEAGVTAPVSANIDKIASYVYKQAGKYTIRVVSKSASIKTTEFTTSFDVTAIVQPTASAPIPPSRQTANVISIYSSAYTNVAGTNYFPDWGQGSQGSSWGEFDLNGDKMLKYSKLSYQGIALADNVTVNVSGMEFIHLDVWTADAQKIETSLISKSNGERPIVRDLVANQWTSIDIPISAFTSQGGFTVADIFQLKFVGTPWAAGTVFIDNIYFYKAATPSAGLVGTWKLASEPGSLKVGPSAGSGEWFSINATQVAERACYYNDTYVFSANGSFSNVLGADTWLEAWQGVANDACGAPVAPYNGPAGATYLYDAVGLNLTITGRGSYVGLPKANNAGELPNVPVPNSITYKVTLTDNNNTMNIVIESGSGVFWSYKLVRI